MEREDYANYLYVVNTWQTFTRPPKAWGFLGPGFTAAEYINSACFLYVLKNGFDKANAYNFKTLFIKPQLWDKLYLLNKKNSDEVFAWAGKVLKLDPVRMTDKQLVKYAESFQEQQLSIHVPRGPMWMLETPDNLVSYYLHNYLAEQYHDSKNIAIKPNQAFRILITPARRSIWSEEKEGLASIALINNKNKQLAALSRHAKKYAWLEYGLQGKILDFNYFEKELSKIQKGKPKKLISRLQSEGTELVKQQTKLFKQYKIGRQHKNIFKIVQDSSYVRMYSKDAQFFGYYAMEEIFKELGRRTGLSLEQVRFLTPYDYYQALIKKKDFSDITRQRQKYSLHFAYPFKTVFYLGKKARQQRKKMILFKDTLKKKDTQELSGQTAYAGKAKGRVKIINTIQEMVKMHSGNVLVSHMTNPGIVPVMKQAAAIITDMGGITCHAAIVARELKTPCVIGTKVATQVFRDGDMVEVDAGKGVVKKV